MKLRFSILLCLCVFSYILNTNAQDSQSDKKQSKAKKEAEEAFKFASTDTLLNSRQFVFQAEFGQGSDMTFVIVDSAFCEVQCGNRNNLTGKITRFEVVKNEKNNTFSVTIKMRSAISTADIFLFLDAYGDGKASVNSDFPGNFAFNGNTVDFEHATVYEGSSHTLH
jgi:hypothetical protein